MILLFALLPALVLSAESAIDWKTCGISNKCYCQEMPSKLQLIEYGYKESTVQACAEVGIQNIYFSEKRILFLMQVIGSDASNLGPNPELAIFIEKAGTTSKVFGCKMENGKVALTGDKIKDYKIKLFEEGDRGSLGDASLFENKNVRCAIVLERGINLYNDYHENENKYSLKLTAATPKEYPMDKQYLFLKSAIKCPYFSLKSNPVVPKTYKTLPVYGSDKDVLNCANYGDSFALRYDNISLSEGELEKVECVKEGEYNIFFVRKTRNETDHIVQVSEKIVNPESYAIFCSAAMDEVCEKPMTCDAGPTCPNFTPGSKGLKATLTCPGDKWLIKDQYHIVQVTCRRDDIRLTNDAVFMTTLSGQTVMIKDTDRCFTEYDCEKKSNVRKSADSVVIMNGVMRCKDDEKLLTIYHEETNVTMNGNSSYTCDPSDGSWKNGSFVVPPGSQAMCKAKPKPKFDPEPLISTGQGTLYAILGSLLVIAVIIAFQALFYYCWSRGLLKKNLKVTAIIGKHYKDMPRSELIADCKEDFGQCLLATPDTHYLVLDGLKKIENLLQEGVEDADAWEEAYKFLLRFHGSIRRIDRPIWHMLSRYLYLETKKIIDKHGWRTVEPIRNGNQKGLIRAVAVHLLSFSLHDFENYDSEKLLLAGFFALGFQGNSQYPHAGLLWALIYHAHPFEQALKTDRTSRFHFNGAKLERWLNKLVKTPCTIPPDQVIPAFGSVQHQAAFALGALPDNTYIITHSKDIVMNTKQAKHEVSMGFFAGLCQSIMRNPIENILTALHLTKPNPTVLPTLHKVAPEAEWNAVAKDGERTMTYYGRHMDAKRLHERFMPTDTETDFFKLQMEQQEFEDAVEKARSDLREWFAARTDKEELKKKPAEFINPSVKLSKFGDYVTPPPKKGPAGSKKASSGSKSKSGSNSGGGGGSSGSNSSDGKASPPSEPKEAAAAAAAAAPAATPAAAAPASN